MSSLASFHTLIITLSNTERAIQETLRLKVPRHIDESMEDFTAKIVAYCHSYQTDLTISKKLKVDSEPAFFIKNPEGIFKVWCSVGEISTTTLLNTPRHSHPEIIRSYFYSVAQIEDFAIGLKGSTKNWVEPIEFYLMQLPTKLLSIFTESLSLKLDLTIIDNNMIYIGYENDIIEIELNRISVWDTFQEVIA